MKKALEDALAKRDAGTLRAALVQWSDLPPADRDPDVADPVVRAAGQLVQVEKLNPGDSEFERLHGLAKGAFALVPDPKKAALKADQDVARLNLP